MTLTRDELAGIVDLFGALSREELRQAVEEVTYRVGEPPETADIEAQIDDALEEYYLVRIDPTDLDSGDEFEIERRDREGTEYLLTAGPTALPSLPEHGTDLPHLLDIEARVVDREALGGAVLERLRDETERVVEAGNTDRADRLLDVCYDAEAWAPIDTSNIRESLAGVSE